MRETRLRSLAKAISWRIVATLVTILSVWALTGQLGVAAASGGIAAVGNLLVYYVHERVWQRVGWGMGEGTGERSGVERGRDGAAGGG